MPAGRENARTIIFFLLRFSHLTFTDCVGDGESVPVSLSR